MKCGGHRDDCGASSQRLIRADAGNWTLAFLLTELERARGVDADVGLGGRPPRASRCVQFYASTSRVYYKSWSRHMAREEGWSKAASSPSPKVKRGSPFRRGEILPFCFAHRALPSKHPRLVPRVINPFLFFNPSAKETSYKRRNIDHRPRPPSLSFQLETMFLQPSRDISSSGRRISRSILWLLIRLFRVSGLRDFWGKARRGLRRDEYIEGDINGTARFDVENKFLPIEALGRALGHLIH